MATNNLNVTSNFTQMSTQKMQAQLSVHEFSMFTSKIEAFFNSLINTLSNLWKRASNYANTDLLQHNITSLENKLKSKDGIIQLLLETQVLTNSSNLKAKQPKQLEKLSQLKQ